MNNKLVIFGTKQIAEVLGWYFSHDSNYDIVAYTVEAAYLTQSTFQGKPVIAFEEVTSVCPPETHDMFVAMSYAKRNVLRAQKYAAAKAAGYHLASHISPRANVWSGITLGDNTFIMENNVVQPFAGVGSDTILWAGNHIGHHSTIGDHCFLASHIVVSGAVTIGNQCFIGVNATLRDGIVIGDECIIGAGALLLGDALPGQVYKADATPVSRIPSSRVRV